MPTASRAALGRCFSTPTRPVFGNAGMYGLSSKIQQRFTAQFYRHGRGWEERTFKIPDSRLPVIDIIDRTFYARGVPEIVTAAAIVNGIAESGLNPEAAGDWAPAGECPGWELPPVMKVLQKGQPAQPACAHSVGIFQCNDRGAGKGKSARYRMDAANNSNLIIDEYERSYGDRIRQMVSDGVDGYGNPVSVGDFAYQWCYDIERPAAKDLDGQSRKNMALAAFPHLAAGARGGATPTPTPPPRPSPAAAPRAKSFSKPRGYAPRSTPPPQGGGGGGGGLALFGLVGLGALALSRR